MKTYADDMIPGDVFHPSEIVKDELEARGIKQIELAKSRDLTNHLSACF